MELRIIWYDRDGKVIGTSETEDDSVESLEEYINDTTEGLDPPDGWDQFLVRIVRS